MDVSHVMGNGFPIDKAPHETIKELLIFATGSGISPIRSLIESGALEVNPAPATHGILAKVCMLVLSGLPYLGRLTSSSNQGTFQHHEASKTPVQIGELA